MSNDEEIARVLQEFELEQHRLRESETSSSFIYESIHEREQRDLDR